MKTNKTLKNAGILTLAAATTGLAGVANADTIRLNGQPLATSAQPMTMNGRTLVPMRDIFEALGARVNYNSVTRGITANRGTTKVDLQIGNRTAAINGQNRSLEQAPIIRGGVTFVPLRFVSESMGANVRYNANRRVVNITTNGGRFGANPVRGGSQVAGYRTIAVPAGVVVPVTLDQNLSSADARVGDTFTATVRSQRLGDSEFPAGTKIEGRISEAQPRDGSTPGVLDLDFRAAILPDGTRVPLRGELIALDEKSVQSTSTGRITARSTKASNQDRLKVIGIGAAGGFLLGRVLKKDGALPTILGALGGLVYSQQQNKAQTREAQLPQGAELGVRLNNGVSYSDTTGYYNERVNYVSN
jgi:hypothetical protein